MIIFKKSYVKKVVGTKGFMNLKNLKLLNITIYRILPKILIEAPFYDTIDSKEGAL